MRIVKLTDKQFDGLDVVTRRSLIQQLMIIDTPKYKYTLGAIGNLWTMWRYDRQECIGSDKWQDDYEPEVVDRWK